MALSARRLVSATRWTWLAALLACGSESAPLQHGATSASTTGVSTSGNGASGTGSVNGGAGGAQTGRSGGFPSADAAMADVSADGSGMLDPVDARSGGGDGSFAADARADISDAISTEAPALPARVLL